MNTTQHTMLFLLQHLRVTTWIMLLNTCYFEPLYFLTFTVVWFTDWWQFYFLKDYAESLIYFKVCYRNSLVENYLKITVVVENLHTKAIYTTSGETTMSSFQNQWKTLDMRDTSGGGVSSNCPLIKNVTVPDADFPYIPLVEFNGNSCSSSSSKPSSDSELLLSQSEQGDVNKMQLITSAISGTSPDIFSEDNSYILINNPDQDNFKSSIEKYQIIELYDFSNKANTSSDPISNIDNDSKDCTGIVDISSDSSFLPKNILTKTSEANKRLVDELTLLNTVSYPINCLPIIEKDPHNFSKYGDELKGWAESASLCSYSVNTFSEKSSDALRVHKGLKDEGLGASMHEYGYRKQTNTLAATESLYSSVFTNSEMTMARLANISLPAHSSCPDHTSFLLSLTPEIPEEMCHPEAVKYKGRSFSKYKNELVDLLFKLYNKEIFYEKLPPLEVEWSNNRNPTSGISNSSYTTIKNDRIPFHIAIIRLSNTVVKDAAKVRDVLVHELCHAANWFIDGEDGGHGPLFSKWVDRIWIKFPELPKVKTAHSDLIWNYQYRCSRCDFELGLIKSNLNEIACTQCGGLVIVNTSL